MLRAVTRLEVFEVIENSYFGSENYSLQFGEDGSSVAFYVRFLADPRFDFKALRVSGDYFRVVEAPGEKFLAADEIQVEGFHRVIGRLRQWLDRIRQEVIATNPFSREIVDLRSQLDQRLASMGEELAGFFTLTEAAELSAWLSRFENQLKELSEENAELLHALESLSKTVSDLKDATQSVNRGTWFRMAGGRLLGGLKALSKSQEAREFALEAAKKFLLEGPK